MTTADHYAERERRAKENDGWDLADDEIKCPRLLVGRPCLNEDEPGKCWCSSRLKDHAATWFERGGTAFVLWEPYGPVDDEELADLFAKAHADCLQVEICASPWNPGRTIGIRFRLDDRRLMGWLVDE